MPTGSASTRSRRSAWPIGRLLSATNDGREWLRLAYTRPPGQLRRAVPALAQAWHEPGQARARQRAS